MSEIYPYQLFDRRVNYSEIIKNKKSKTNEGQIFFKKFKAHSIPAQICEH